MLKTPKISAKYPKTFKISVKTFAWWFPYCNSFQRLLLWKPSILIARIKFQISLRPNLCEQYSAWRWDDLSANTILVNRERIQRYHPPIPMIYHTAGSGLIFVESTTWMEYLLCIYYLNYLAMFHINFVISIQACTNLTTAITRVCVLPKSRRTVFMAVPGSPWFPTGGPRSLPRPFIHSMCVARRRHRRHSRDP